MRKAWEILEQDGMTTFAHARDKYGNRVPVYSKKACTFCARGAIMRKYVEGLSETEANERLTKLLNDDEIYLELQRADNVFYRKTGVNMVTFNDHYTTFKEQVISILKEADI